MTTPENKAVLGYVVWTSTEVTRTPVYAGDFDNFDPRFDIPNRRQLLRVAATGRCRPEVTHSPIEQSYEWEVAAEWAE